MILRDHVKTPERSYQANAMLRAALGKTMSHNAKAVTFYESYFILGLSSIQLAMPNLRKTIQHQLLTGWNLLSKFLSTIPTLVARFEIPLRTRVVQ